MLADEITATYGQKAYNIKILICLSFSVPSLLLIPKEIRKLKYIPYLLELGQPLE